MRSQAPDGRSPTTARRGLVLLLALLLPAGAAAQQGTVIYDRSIRYEFEVPEGLEERAGVEIPSSDVTSMVLLFDGTQALLRPAPGEEEEPPRPVSDRMPVETGARIQMMLTRLKMSSTSRSDQEALLETYASYSDGTLAETRELLGRKFLITGELPAWAWRLTGEEGEFLGYRVQKATAERDSMTVEAWFTPEIAVQAGPGPFAGLPGLILVVSVNDGHTQYTATEVSLDPIGDGAIQAPTEGDPVSRDEYEAIVEEKLEELRTTRGRRGGGGLG